MGKGFLAGEQSGPQGEGPRLRLGVHTGEAKARSGKNKERSMTRTQTTGNQRGLQRQEA